MRLGWSPERLAAAVPASVRSVFNWERGLTAPAQAQRAGLERLARLAQKAQEDQAARDRANGNGLQGP